MTGADAPMPAVPVQHGSHPRPVPKKRPIDFYRQLPICRHKEKDVFEYVVQNGSQRSARGRRPSTTLSRDRGARAASRARRRCR
jgi:hypothetical protein